jgi:hypothetical protein
MTARVLRLLAVACLAPATLLAAALPAQAAGATPAVRTPAVRTPAVRSAAHQRVDVVRASGTFDVLLDLESFRLQPVGNRCLLTVSGTLTFAGTLLGTATATTTALEDASCDEVAASPPGTFADIFTSTGAFSGTVDGRPVSADLVYAGRTAVGGSIEAIMRFTGDLTGVLHVDATLGVGGSYRGVLVVH